VARELGITQANASYHLRQLAAAGEVIGAGERRVRGGAAKLYRHQWDAARRSEPGSDRLRHVFVAALAAELTRRHALHAPRKAGHQTFTDAELWVELGIWREVVASVDAAVRRLHEGALAPDTPGALRVSMTAALFEMRSSDQEASA